MRTSIVFTLTYIILACSWQLLYRKTVAQLRAHTNREPAITLQYQQYARSMSVQVLPALPQGCRRSPIDPTLRYQRRQWWSLRFKKLSTRFQARLSRAPASRFQTRSHLQYISVDQTLLRSLHQISPPAFRRAINQLRPSSIMTLRAHDLRRLCYMTVRTLQSFRLVENFRSGAILCPPRPGAITVLIAGRQPA